VPDRNRKAALSRRLRIERHRRNARPLLKIMLSTGGETDPERLQGQPESNQRAE
jgi:hypothetical protein